jgi:hypothetical protein
MKFVQPTRIPNLIEILSVFVELEQTDRSKGTYSPFKHSLYRPGQALRVPGGRVRGGSRGVYALGIHFLLIRNLNSWK